MNKIRTIEEVSKIIRLMPYQFTLGEIDKFVEMLNERLDEILEIHKAERPTGEWILLEDCSNSGYYCNQCNKKVVKEGWSDTVKKIKFCPNCGSYNGGEQE